MLSEPHTGRVTVVLTINQVIAASGDTMRRAVACRHRGGGVFYSRNPCTRAGVCLDGYGPIQTTCAMTGRKNGGDKGSELLEASRDTVKTLCEGDDAPARAHGALCVLHCAVTGDLSTPLGAHFLQVEWRRRVFAGAADAGCPGR